MQQNLEKKAFPILTHKRNSAKNVYSTHSKGARFVLAPFCFAHVKLRLTRTVAQRAKLLNAALDIEKR